MSITIELGQFINKDEKALVGRPYGEAIKNQLIKAGSDFEALEKKDDKIIIVIPPEIVSVNKSFFLGLFELAIQRLGRENFIKKYEIHVSENIAPKILDYVQAALLSASQKDILG